MSFSRRLLLAALPTTLGAWVLSRLGLDGNPDIDGLLRVLGDPGKARAIGEACLGIVGEPSARALLSEANATELRVRIRDNFAQGNVIVADGWVLSATEARLYTLAALIS